MADSNLNTSIASLKTEILSAIPNATASGLLDLTRSAKGIGLSEDADIENAVNTRANTLVSTATTDDIIKISSALKQLRNPTNVTVTNITSVTGDLIPDSNEAYDLGSPSNKFRDLYISGNTMYLGSTQISVDNDGNLNLPTGTKIGTDTIPSAIDDLSNVDTNVQPETLEIQVADPTAGHGTAWQWTWTQSALPYARITITNQTQTSVPLYMQGTYQINNFAITQYGPMTQTHAFKLKWIEGAGDDNLVSWVTYSTIDHSHPDINSGNTTSVQRLAVSVPSSITLPTLTAPSISYTVTAVTGAYVFSGTASASGNNTEIGPFYRGGTYTVNINAVGHPFYFTTDNGTGFVAGDYVGEWTSGVTNSRTDNGTITFTVPSNAPDVLYYQCGNHSVMRGTIRVKDLEVEQNENGNYIIYGQHSQEKHVQKMEIRPIPTLTSQMCLVYDATISKFVPQDLSTYVENTPAFKNKIKEVAGTATLVAPDGTSLVASVEIYSLESYLPLVGNTNGDIAFAQDTSKLYIWDGSEWITAVADGSATGSGGAGVTTYALLSDLPTSGNTQGDLGFVTATKALYVWDGTSWVNSNANTTFYMLRAGNFVAPLTGTKTFSPDRTVSLQTLTATIEQSVNAAVFLSINKNGSELQQFTIPTGQNTVTANFTTNSILTTDILTLDVDSGSGENLTVKVDYV